MDGGATHPDPAHPDPVHPFTIATLLALEDGAGARFFGTRAKCGAAPGHTGESHYGSEVSEEGS